MIKDHQNIERRKAWVCIFTCVAVRAIHLEIVEDLSAEAFIQTLRRFIARRGTPKEIISDNASQFKLAKSSMDMAWSNMIQDIEVQSYVAGQGIKWNFIVELSPWMGGFYERLVGSSKMALRKTIGRKCLTMLQLQTFLTETEAVLNSRPLTYVGEEINDTVIITPAHFLSMNTKTGTPQLGTSEDIEDPTYNDNPSTKEILLNTWMKGQNDLETFWKVWKDDYLLNLRERSQIKLKSGRVVANEVPRVGNIVQVKEDLPRGSWKVAKIVELIPNSDGEIRAAKVLLPTKNIVNRPLNLLYPLECEEYPEERITEVKTELPNDNIPRRTKRKAAIHARDRILGQSLDGE